MSAASWTSLQEAAGPVSRETFERLVAFEAAVPEMEPQHQSRRAVDAGRCLGPPYPRQRATGANRTAGQALGRSRFGRRFSGPGAGFPAGRASKAQSIDLVESNRKKASFLQAVIGQFDLPARVVARRIDDSYALVSAPEIVTARALAPLAGAARSVGALADQRARAALFHKGRDYRAEVEESTHRWAFDLVEHPSMTDAAWRHPRSDRSADCVSSRNRSDDLATRNEFLA